MQRSSSMMVSLLESLPNEIFLHEIFPFLTLIDLNYTFLFLNQRFHQIVQFFLTDKFHSIYLTSDIPWNQYRFLIDEILPNLKDNQRLKTIELSHADLFSRFFANLHRINTNSLEKFVVRPFVDFDFHSMMSFLYASSALQQFQLNVLTNVDKTWANGRKWIRSFELMKKIHLNETLKILHVCVWCIQRTDAVHFDQQYWNSDGSYKENGSWKVQIKPDEFCFTIKSRRTVQCSAIDDDRFQTTSTSNCLSS